MGLSIVHGIVKDHSGYIDFESQVGRGTAFIMYFPISRSIDAPAAEDRHRGRGESILVVDDDESQLRIMTRLLETLGYTVTAGRGGEEALRLTRERQTPFDLIITDVIMDAGMDGLETFRQIRAHSPRQPIMLVSGYERARAKVDAAQKLGAGAYLRKPLTLEKVAEAVRRELDRAKGTAGGGAPRQSILIVDDEEPIRRLFRMLIDSEMPGMQIDLAGDGREAVEAFEKRQHMVVIMDLYMPVMDGRQAFAEIERLCKTRGYPMPAVIFCTGFSLPDSLDRIISRGNVHCLLRKPVRSEVLLKALKERLW